MSAVRTTVRTADWALSSDTDTPAAPGVVRALVGPLVATWQIEQLPPVSQPETVTFQIYDRGTTPDPDRWLPMLNGTPIACYVEADGPTAIGQPVTFQGRIADVTAVNLDGGGLLFTLICSGRLADWNSTNAPTLQPVNAVPWLDSSYAALADDADLPLDTYDGITALYDWEDGLEMVNDNVSSGDVLGQIALQDIRGDNSPIEPGRTHWIAYDIDPADPDPSADTVEFVVVPYDPRILDLAGILVLFDDRAGSGYAIAVNNPDYYTDGGTGILLNASQVLQDVGSWITTRAATINTVELTGNFAPTPVETVRVEHADLRISQGRQSRALNSPAEFEVSARLIASCILGPRNQVEQGFGLAQATVIWSTLTDAQITAWGDALWPRAEIARSPGPGGPLGRPLAIVDVPVDWALATGPAVFGRLMGLTVTVDGTAVYLGLSLRALPAAADAGITYDDMQFVWSPDGPAYVDLDPSLSYDDFSLIGP